MATDPLTNKALPMIMHIDLNCCFAIIEQQANRLLRGRPVGVSAYDTPRGFVLAASYEAKRRGVKLGVNNQQARELCPGIVILTPDPAKYREAHRRFRDVLLEYTSDVVAKSIDEFVVDFTGSPALRNMEFQDSGAGPDICDSECSANKQCAGCSTSSHHNQRMLEIGHEIKAKIKQSLGEWVTVNIGIGTNRFLAKYAAGFGKPDGMMLIDHTNVRKMFESGVFSGKVRPATLIDLPGINTRYQARLMAAGIYTPLQFYEADVELLKKIVFKSVLGYHWWARLRGHEVDNRTFARKSIGHQYALPHKTQDKVELARILMKLCEKVGRRLRKGNYCARGIHLYMGFERYRDDIVIDKSHEPGTNTDYIVGAIGFEQMRKLRSWHQGKRLEHRLYATSDIYTATRTLLDSAELPMNVKIMAITVYDLEPWDPEQLSIFDQLTDDITVPRGTDHSPTSQSVDALAVSRLPRKAIRQNGYRSQEATRRLSDAMDAINTRYGEFVVTPATMMDMKGEILDRIAFGTVQQMD